ncbi:hypothetical protein SAMN05421761_102294 [Belliella pelovolcani]|uniref:Uncharacterized protein n=2 Tax=Belliella pelovolcani TaxID=529505 RepID=A0A1N7KRP0_9BACT|nr:hypothetical protein SAMN05421761_102294 [Belliella pelovolcani]
MKTNLFSMFQNGMAVLLSAGLLFSCSQVETFETQDLSVAQAKIPVNFKSTDPNARVGKDYLGMECGTPLTARLLAGQKTPIGEVTVFNTEDEFYVTVSIEKGEGFDNGDWFLQHIQIYAGQTSVDFVAKGKNKIVNPAPGKFPINEVVPVDFSVADQEYTYKLTISEELRGMGEFDVAVHASVINVTEFNEDRTEAVSYKTEGAWAEGQAFNSDGKGNWAMFMSYSIQTCAVSCTDTWFRSVTRSNNGEASEEFESDKFLLMDGTNVVGQATYKRDRDGGTGQNPIYKIEVKFEVLDAAYSFDEWGTFYSSSAISGLNRDSFNDIRTTETGGTVTFTNITEDLYYLGLYAKITGKCKPVTQPEN